MLPEPLHPAGLDDAALLARCRRTFGRASGPGGQHRNKVETAVRLVDEPTGIIAQATERRRREQNQRVALQRLRLKLAIGHRVSRSAGAVPGECWRSRCKGGRIACSAEHADFPTLLAEALDVIAQHDLDIPPAAAVLQVTSSQLIKFIAKSPAALDALNRQRETQGLPRLRG